MLISIIPYGGLANRLRVITSGIALANKRKCRLRIIWIERKELKCPYDKLLLKIDNIEIYNYTNNLFWQILIKFSLSFAVLNFSYITDRLIQTQLETGYFDVRRKNINPLFEERLRKYNFIITCHKFCNYTHFDLQILQPIKDIKIKVEKFISKYKLSNFVAFHIRYTDNINSLKNSPIELFEMAINNCISKGMRVLICTDSYKIKNKLKIQFENNIIFTEISLDRTNIIGIQNAFFELLLLSNSSKIYGSYGSTYSLLASELGGGELILVKTK
ncbi:hypothetical protein EZS27_018256 [termite gut metagenome]|uniref:Uncharacterized protein n=1 Tax=termite gut metagenome TaxID=433724 RepID=A0A5J4RJI5_9ZZZZ